jgi:4-hydroxythreonine-4-phosphate dehydrogenase
MSQPAPGSLVIGDRCVLDDGARVATVRLDLKNVFPDADFSKQPDGAVFIDLGHLDPSSIAPSTAMAKGGQFALANYRHALTLARRPCRSGLFHALQQEGDASRASRL